MKIKNKKGFEFSFGWIFGILVGAFILFLAIYAAANLVNVMRFQGETELGKTLGTLLYPIETNLEEAKFAQINVPQETRIFNVCKEPLPSSVFGAQKLRAAVKSGIGEEWQKDPAVESTFYNKYIFSANMSQGGKQFYVLSKPLEFPFKIADVMMLWSDKEKYCFISPFPDMATELVRIAPKNINDAKR